MIEFLLGLFYHYLVEASSQDPDNHCRVYDGDKKIRPDHC